MAIDWSKPIRTRLHQHIVVLIRHECRVDDHPRRIVRIPGFCLGTFMYREDGAPAMNAPAIENYEPEQEKKTMPVDWTKPVQTKRGTKLRVLCTDAPGVYPVVVMAPSGGINKYPLETTRIINVPEKRTGYINIYDNPVPLGPYIHGDRQQADDGAITKRIACIKVEYTVGQFDT